MSALRFHVPGREVVLIADDVPYVPLRGHATLRGHAVRPLPEPSRELASSPAALRARAWRELQRPLDVPEVMPAE